MSGFIFCMAEISIFGGIFALAAMLFIGGLIEKMMKGKEPSDRMPDVGRDGPDRPADNELDDGPED